jgi:hypothetical protein
MYGVLKAKLGMFIQVVTPGDHFAVNQINEVWDLHD